LIRTSNQGIRKFDERNLNSDSRFGFKEKEVLTPLRTSELDMAQEKNYACNAILAIFLVNALSWQILEI
jgi:hypothetical protein